MARAVWKGPFVDPSLLKKVKQMLDSGKRSVIKTWSRRSMIIPMFVGITFSVYNGKKHVPVYVDENMIGLKLGAMVPTRKFGGHGADKKTSK